MTSNLEKQFQLDLLNASLRQDGRKFNEHRDIQLTFGEEYGNVTVQLGKTKLIVQVSAEVKFPKESRPFEGLFHITTDISSMCSPKFENGTSNTDEETMVSRIVEKSITRSAALDLESLCIQAGKRCWMIRADVHYIDYDGGLVDATTFGVIAALLHFKRPDTSIDGDKVIIHTYEERPPVPLSVLHTPISVSWSFIDMDPKAQADADVDMDNDEEEPQFAILDATAIEQEIRSGEMIITVNKNREVCQVTKTGSYKISPAQFIEFCEPAYEIALKLTKIISDELHKDNKKRSKGNANLLHSAMAPRSGN